MKENERAPYVDIIKQIMTENSLSQQKFADIVGVNQTTVSQWLLGRKNRLTIIFTLFALSLTLVRTSFSGFNQSV